MTIYLVLYSSWARMEYINAAFSSKELAMRFMQAKQLGEDCLVEVTIDSEVR